MKRWKDNRLVIAGFLGVLVGAQSAHAAQVSWSGQSLITGDSDVTAAGSAVYAYSLGNNLTPVVNGVSFTPAVSHDGSPDFDYSDSNVVFHNYTQYTGFGAPPNISPGSQYANLLTSAGYAPNAGNDMVLTLNVTPGQSYLLRLWANDARGFHVGSTETLAASSGGTPGSLTIAENYPSGFGGTFVTGTFIADASTEVITIDGNDEQQINALELRNITSIPEPAAGLTIAIGTAALALRRRRVIGAR